MVDERFVGKTVPTSEFAGDDGRANPDLIEALEGFRAGSVPRNQVLLRIASARVFVPVKAMLDSVEQTDEGHQVEKDSHMATVSIALPDGRRGLLAFTSVSALADWDSEARPVPAWGRSAAAAAEGEGAQALLVDFGSPHLFVIEGDALAAMAEGESLWEPVADPEIQRAVMDSIAEIARDNACQFELGAPRGDADIRVSVLATPTLNVLFVLEQSAAALAANDVLRARLPRGVELGVDTSSTP